MKKSIKYAGIAAATLLTVAPVAAPVVSNVTTVQAADAGNTPSSELSTAKDKFAKQFSDLDTTDGASYAGLTLGEKNAKGAAYFVKANTAVIDSPAARSYLTTLDGKNAKYYMTATDAQGNTYNGNVNKDADALEKAINADKDTMLPITFTVMGKDVDVNGEGDTYTKIASFKLTKDESTELKSINAKFTTPVTVAKNSKVAVAKLVSSTNVALTDQDNEALSTKSTTLGDNFYYTYAAALDSAKDGADANTGVVDASDIETKADGEFKTAGTYYQTVKYTAGTDTKLADFITAYNGDPSSYTIYVNGNVASSSYDFITAGDAITFVRTVKVSDSESTWTTEKISGVVTTKNDASYYTLKNDDNASIKNRALAKNTAWKTNAVRTDQNGNKQYRVATGEWIDSDSVTYGETSTASGLTDVTKVKGVVTINKGANYVFPLFDSNGDEIKGRAVSGDSAWQVAATAKDADGNVYYKVATNEWVMGGEGVTFA